MSRGAVNSEVHLEFTAGEENDLFLPRRKWGLWIWLGSGHFLQKYGNQNPHASCGVSQRDDAEAWRHRGLPSFHAKPEANHSSNDLGRTGNTNTQTGINPEWCMQDDALEWKGRQW